MLMSTKAVCFGWGNTTQHITSTKILLVCKKSSNEINLLENERVLFKHSSFNNTKSLTGQCKQILEGGEECSQQLQHFTCKLVSN